MNSLSLKFDAVDVPVESVFPSEDQSFLNRVQDEYKAAKARLLSWSEELEKLAVQLGESRYYTLKTETRYDGSQYHTLSRDIDEPYTWYQPYDFTTAYSQKFLKESIDQLLEARNQHVVEYFNLKYHLVMKLPTNSLGRRLNRDESLLAVTRFILESLDGQDLVERGLNQIKNELSRYIDKAQITKQGIIFPHLRVGSAEYYNSHSRGCKAIVVALSYFLFQSLVESTSVRALFTGDFDHGKLVAFEPNRKLVGFRSYLNGRLILYFQTPGDAREFWDLFASCEQSV